MNLDFQIPLYELVECLAEAVDLISPELANHHKQVAYISLHIAREMKLSPEQQSNVTLAGFLHDSGGLAIKERLEALRFEVESPYQHAELGFRLFQKFEPLAPIAQLIRYHHLPYEEVTKACRLLIPGTVLRGSFILHLADRVSVLIDPRKNILGQASCIRHRIAEYTGTMFDPDVAASFFKISEREYFWLDLISPSINTFLQERSNYFNIELNLNLLAGFAKLFGQIVDFRSRFTATHSGGTAACAEALARFANFSEREGEMLKIAGLLHDLGKIVVPEDILNKEPPLTSDERDAIKAHPYYTYRLLKKIRNFEPISSWAGYHHEKLNGSGYPFHLNSDNLVLGSRIICIADIFAALTEDRPYRKGMSTEESLRILSQMADCGEIDANLLNILKSHYHELNQVRINAQNEAIKEYSEFWDTPMQSYLENLASLKDGYREIERPIDLIG